MTRLRTLLRFLKWPVEMPMWFAICVLVVFLSDATEPVRRLLVALAEMSAP